MTDLFDIELLRQKDEQIRNDKRLIEKLSQQNQEYRERIQFLEEHIRYISGRQKASRAAEEFLDAALDLIEFMIDGYGRRNQDEVS